MHEAPFLNKFELPLRICTSLEVPSQLLDLDIADKYEKEKRLQTITTNDAYALQHLVLVS